MTILVTNCNAFYKVKTLWENVILVPTSAFNPTHPFEYLPQHNVRVLVLVHNAQVQANLCLWSFSESDQYILANFGGKSVVYGVWASGHLARIYFTLYYECSNKSDIG